jgi:hypothetical protein
MISAIQLHPQRVQLEGSQLGAGNVALGVGGVVLSSILAGLGSGLIFGYGLHSYKSHNDSPKAAAVSVGATSAIVSLIMGSITYAGMVYVDSKFKDSWAV